MTRVGSPSSNCWAHMAAGGWTRLMLGCKRRTGRRHDLEEAHQRAAHLIRLERQEALDAWWHRSRFCFAFHLVVSSSALVVSAIASSCGSSGEAGAGLAEGAGKGTEGGERLATAGAEADAQSKAAREQGEGHVS